MAATLFATVAGVDGTVINRGCVIYTIARVAFAVAYLGIETYRLSYLRSALWWTGNYGCITLLWAAGKKLS